MKQLQIKINGKEMKYKFETIEIKGVHDDEKIISTLNDFYEKGWKLINITYFSERDYQYQNGSQIIESHYVKFLLENINV